MEVGGGCFRKLTEKAHRWKDGQLAGPGKPVSAHEAMMVCAQHSPLWSPILCGLSGYQGPRVGPAVSSCFFYLWHQDGVGLPSQPISLHPPCIVGPPKCVLSETFPLSCLLVSPDHLCRVLAAVTLNF